jgi:hypothetical protein
MAFVPDFNEEELQRALAAQGAGTGAPVGAPVGGTGESVGSPSGPGAPGAASGDPQSTGFVNLARYYDANRDGAAKQAGDLMGKLQVDPAAAGNQAASAVPEPTLTTIPTTAGDWARPDATAADQMANRRDDATNSANASDYEKALAQYPSDQEKARADAIKGVAGTQIDKGQQIVNDPTKRNEAMSVNGQNPSEFDSYLTGAAIAPAFQGLKDFYGYGQSRTVPQPPSDPLNIQDRPPRPPGDPNTRGPRVQSAASAMDPQIRKRQQGAEGW